MAITSQASRNPCDPKVAYNIGWDAGLYGLTYFDSWPADFRTGWAEARKRHPRPKKSDKFIRKWIQLRAGAFQRGKAFSEEVTPNYLRMICGAICPVTFRPFTYAQMNDEDWSIDRIDNDRGYERRNLAAFSAHVNRAKSDLSFNDIEELCLKRHNVPGLTVWETLNLYRVMMPFCAPREPDFEDHRSFYGGYPILPDAPLPWLMALQVFISMSIRNHIPPRFQIGLVVAAKRSGSYKPLKKMMKRLCKKMNVVDYPFMMLREWNNERNIDNFGSWIANIRADDLAQLQGFATELHASLDEESFKQNMEKWVYEASKVESSVIGD